MFVNKVKETEAELKEKEREVGVPKTCERSPKYSQHRIWVWATYESWKAHAALEQTSPAKAQTHTHAPSPTQKRGHRVMFSKQHHWFRRLRNSSLPHPVQCGWLSCCLVSEGQRRTFWWAFMSGGFHPWRLTGHQSKRGNWAGVPCASGVTGEEISGPSSKLVANKWIHNVHSPLEGLQTESRSSAHLLGAPTFSWFDMWCQVELNLPCLHRLLAKRRWLPRGQLCRGACTVQGHWCRTLPTSWSLWGGGDSCGSCDCGSRGSGAGGAQPDGSAGCNAQRVCLLPAAWEIWALKKDTPGREKEGGGEEEGAGGRDECFQQAESSGGNLAVPILAGYLTAATEKGQRQEKVSDWTWVFLLYCWEAGRLLRCFNAWSIA